MTALNDFIQNGHFIYSAVTNARFRGNNLIRSFTLWFLNFIFSNGHSFTEIKVTTIT
jgi:hypothetical protein